jgi:opacity protein-like surface antigen
MISTKRSGIAVAALSLLISAPVFAQIQTERAYVVGFGGAAMSTTNAALFGGGVGVSIGRDVQAFGEFGRMQDVVAGFTSDDLKTAMNEARAEGLTLAAKTTIPTAYALGGLRYLAPTGGIVRPYVSFAGGVAHMMPDPSFVLEGVDVTSVTLQDANMKNIFRTDNRPVAALGAGVATTLAKHVKVDVGYKYSRIFVNTDYLQSPDSPHQHKHVDVHRVQFGVGYAF